ncbi:MAG TPA: hypothetical protein VHM19_10345, partial [Polyangiales bacterium]|nr:hypothetical protein [Polyangiales bacterium]
SYRIEEFEHAVRMDARGNVLTGNGAVEEHAALAAYGCRLGDLMGELLGLGPMIAVEGALRPAGRCLIFRDAAGDTVLLRPRAGVDLSRLRAQLAL